LTKYVPLDVGPLQVTTINLALGLSLKPGIAHFSALAQEHADDKHPNDFAICMDNIARIVRAPSYVGRGPKAKDGFELIGEVKSPTSLVLIALKIEPDEKGRYIVSSAYRIDQKRLDTRIDRGYCFRT
jgi:hypothetical protein